MKRMILAASLVASVAASSARAAALDALERSHVRTWLERMSSHARLIQARAKFELENEQAASSATSIVVKKNWQWKIDETQRQSIRACWYCLKPYAARIPGFEGGLIRKGKADALGKVVGSLTGNLKLDAFRATEKHQRTALTKLRDELTPELLDLLDEARKALGLPFPFGTRPTPSTATPPTRSGNGTELLGKSPTIEYPAAANATAASADEAPGAE